MKIAIHTKFVFLFRVYRLFALVSLVAAYFVFSFTIHLITTEPIKRRRRFAHNVSMFSGLALRIMNIRVEVKNLPPTDKTYLIICNHLGYFDIFAMAAQLPSLFITSVEMRETPVLGLITEMGGCLYVERRTRSNIHGEIKEIEAALNEGFNVVLYPEGTSGDGRQVMPFKKSLLTAGASSEANIMMSVINYRKINGEPMQEKFRDWVFWYGDLGIGASVWNAAGMYECIVELEFIGEITVDTTTDRREIASKAYEQMDQRFHKIT